ncbi:phosphate acetyltransferase [[Mycoplasma] testudinis]|uniref:phosphate acetyltransferase n=1 Tax=[Mycoplasma] testudinis TaxID=33924 RepID=UPI00048A4247|nr:phosphate acetyltransferase [[Mycoplasma] testudinis]
MSAIIENLKIKIKESKKVPKILFVEGWSKFVQSAVMQLSEEKIIKPILLFRDKSEIPASLPPNIVRIIVNTLDLVKYAKELYELRKAKGMTLPVALEEVKKPNVLAAMLVKLGEVDGEVCGKEYATKDTLKPALQIIKTDKQSKIVSSAFAMDNGHEKLVFADCAINLNPTAEELAEITISAVKFAREVLNFKDINCAMLSYSTYGSGQGESVDKVKKAYEIVNQAHLPAGVSIAGEMQFDAAYVEAIRNQKAPKLHWESGANVFVFPNIDAGNIGYKIAQRLGGYEAIGPILLGLAKPVNDLSRGASVQEIADVGIITASQAIAQ